MESRVRGVRHKCLTTPCKSGCWSHIIWMTFAMIPNQNFLRWEKQASLTKISGKSTACQAFARLWLQEKKKAGTATGLSLVESNQNTPTIVTFTKRRSAPVSGPDTSIREMHRFFPLLQFHTVKRATHAMWHLENACFYAEEVKQNVQCFSKDRALPSRPPS